MIGTTQQILLGAALLTATASAWSAPVHSAASYDYVIVGGGTAGLTVAARLTEDPNVKVLVIEAGPDGRNNPNVTDLKNRYLPYGTEVDWAPLTVPQRSANGRRYQQIQGRVLGGSSAINGAAWIRPDAREYPHWEALGATGWTFDRIYGYSKKSENFTTYTGGALHPDLSLHGTKGPIHVSIQNDINPFWDDTVFPTLRTANHTVVDDPTGGKQGSSYTEISCYPNTTTRSYSATGYYTPNENRTNLELLLSSQVSRIIWSKGGESLVATGVEYHTGNGTAANVTAKNVIVSAGTLHTPKVLELSGIGNKSILEPLGIEVKVDSPGVGSNLQNQIGVSVIFTLQNITNWGEAQQPVLDLVPAYAVLPADAQTEQAAMLANKTADISQDQFDALKAMIDQGVPQTETFWSTSATNGTVSLTLYTTDLHTFSRGTVHINSTDYAQPPLYDPNYLSAPHDLWYLSRAILHGRALTQTPPLASYVTGETTPGANYTDIESIEEWLKSNFRTMSHFVGTSAARASLIPFHTLATLTTHRCSAVPFEKNGVVDPETFIVHGTENVRVIDASVIPLLPGVHTEAIVYAIAEMAAATLRHGH
ncbi:hypothetical protein OF83DRAFT_769458 [Amylostereum chailletii]|nr:hypothetical protein OF83DRAFT_769458 [Amylostereum chailletii]